ncbi:MAG: flagellar hook-basal body complex protein FliE, partial [Epulopiscium sp.]|nr:flagellar hook-basal body complex protein FliE [Candidatus Epulonipiscium sp.]
MDICSVNLQTRLQEIQNKNTKTQQVNESENDFDGFYKNALKMWNKTNEFQKEAEHMALEFAAGRFDNFHALTIAQAKANVSLEYTVQVRNQILDAYREIMR